MGSSQRRMIQRLGVWPAIVVLLIVAAACGSGTAGDTSIDGDDGFTPTSTREDTVARVDPTPSSDTPDGAETTTTTAPGDSGTDGDATAGGEGDGGGADSTAVDSDGDGDAADGSGGGQRADKVTDDGPIVVVAFEGVLGWWDGSWHEANEGAVPTDVGDQFEIVTVDGEASIAIGGGVASTCPFDETPGVVVGITGPTEWLDPVPIAVHNAPNPLPRPIATSDGSPAGYDEIVTEYLVGRGLNPDGAEIVQFVRADLEGDDVDEAFLVIEKMSNQLNPARPGDYSIAIVRQIADGEVRTTVLDESLVRPPTTEGEVVALDVMRFAALADLDTDGDFEIALNTLGYEYSSTAVFDHDGAGQPPTRILAVGCGV